MAFEDGAVLAAHVQESGLSVDTLRAFEKERIPRVATILRQEQACTSSCCAQQKHLSRDSDMLWVHEHQQVLCAMLLVKEASV